MENPHRASAIAQVVFYAPIVPITLYVGCRAWKYGPRLAWAYAMLFACVRLTGGALALASQNDPGNISMIAATIVLLNIGLVPLLMPFHALIRIVLEANFPESKKKEIFIRVTRLLLMVAVSLLGTAGALLGKPEMAQAQSILSKVAYFEFVLVLLALVGLAVWLNFWRADQIKDGQLMYIHWLLISSPFLCVRAVFGVISVFEASGDNLLTSMWSPMFGNALLFSLMALLPEYAVLCVFVYLGFHRISTADRYGVIAQKGVFGRADYTKSKVVQDRGSTEMV
ncbi:uncharacterized protein PG998_010305 [Apiospora kogelbergensis]|uniref:uncharacterized protein n=1 Tax=Apiospora kogelbergensis TaxID=1337665 RepID=UPI00312EC332